MKAIKKVEVVPLDYNIGKIINSASSSDDKTKNTYSMKIIDDKISETIDYVDETATNLETVQTFTETLSYTGTPTSGEGIEITTLWKKVGKIVTLSFNVYIPRGKGGLINLSHFIFTIPEWAKPTSTSNFLNFNNGTSKVLGYYYDRKENTSGTNHFATLNLITNDTHGLILYGSCNNGDTNNDYYHFGTITYILD